jgi:hypothetical protein
MTIPVSVVGISVAPRIGKSWAFMLKTKSVGLNEESAGKLTQVLRTHVHVEIKTSQGEAFDEHIDFTELPDDPVPEGGQTDLGLDGAGTTEAGQTETTETSTEGTQEKKRSRSRSNLKKKVTPMRKPEKGRKKAGRGKK